MASPRVDGVQHTQTQTLLGWTAILLDQGPTRKASLSFNDLLKGPICRYQDNYIMVRVLT